MPSSFRSLSIREVSVIQPSGAAKDTLTKPNRRISPRTGNRSALSPGNTGLPAVCSRHSNAGPLKAALPLFK